MEQNWISVKDRLPKEKIYVLVYGKSVGINQAEMIINNKKMIVWDNPDFFSPVKDITHWMPLPEPPKDL